MPAQLQRYGFLLMPRFALLSLAGAVDALRLTNELLGEHAYEVQLLSLDGRPVTAATGGAIHTAPLLQQVMLLDGLFVVADTLPQPDEAGLPLIEAATARVAAARGLLGGIGTGAAWLARVGQLRGYRCTLHWLHTAQLAAGFADSIVSNNLYEIDRNRLTCAGHTASLDLLICWLGQRHGERLVQQLLSQFGLERLRGSDERQQVPSPARLGASAKLVEAVALMETNLSEPLSTEDIANLVGVSRRQLERLFKQHLNTLPSRWYLEQRLALARRLLQQSSQSILQIGLSCGFTSGAHFSNAYRSFFGRTPRDERSVRAAAWRATPVAAETSTEDAERIALRRAQLELYERVAGADDTQPSHNPTPPKDRP